MVGGSGVVEEIFSSLLTTLDAFFRHSASARHGKIFSVIIEVQSRLRTWARHHFFSITSWSSLLGTPFFWENKPQQENSLLDVQRWLIRLYVLGPHYEQLYWYFGSSYLIDNLSSGICNGGGIWCCRGEIIISPHQSCCYLFPSCLIQTRRKIFWEHRSSVMTAHMGAPSILGHHFLVHKYFHRINHNRITISQTNVQRRLIRLTILGPN